MRRIGVRRGNNNDGAQGNPQILVAVQGVQSTVNSLQTAVTALQESVNALAEVNAGNVRSTAPVSLHQDVLGCTVSNISDQTRTVRFQSFGGGGAPIFDFPLALAPNTSTGVFSDPFFGTAYCKFTVMNGTSADIRASISVHDATGQKQRFAIAAQ